MGIELDDNGPKDTTGGDARFREAMRKADELIRETAMKTAALRCCLVVGKLPEHASPLDCIIAIENAMEEITK